MRASAELLVSSVKCPTASGLLEDYAEAVTEFSLATEALRVVAGQRGAFAEPKERADEARSKCRAARQALEQHYKEHRCRGSAPQWS